MSDQSEYTGNHCIVLPKDYLSSARAVSEIYDDELNEAVGDLHVDNLDPERGFFRGTLAALLIWVVPSVWMVCL